MLQSIALMLFGLIALIGTSDAAVLITIDDRGNTTTHAFENQVFYHLEGDTPGMRIDLNTNMCSLFMHDFRVHVEGQCDKAQQEMEAAVSAAMQQQGISREQMVAMRKMGEQHRQQRIDIKPAGSETIAGYKSECYHMSPTQTTCISAAVMELINREVSTKKMIRMMRQFSRGSFGRAPSEADQAKQKLWEKGYIMKDVDLAATMPNAGVLQRLPKAVRQRMMDQLRQSGAKPQGQVVVKIEKNATFTPKMPNYPKKSWREFARLMMTGR